MRISFVQPAIGHRQGEKYLRSWQMEPLPIATLAGLTPASVERSFYDDRMETICYDEPTDAVAIPLETYTARRGYQIASHYRSRGVPVIVGGFHATLVPDEAARYADSVILGEAESVWAEVLDDLAHGTLKPRYQGSRTDLSGIAVDRSIFRGKRYLPVGLVETGRGCRFPCEFCAVQSFFGQTYRTRPADGVIRELEELRHGKNLFFFVDDNFAGDFKAGRELLPELARLKLRWVTQMSINAAHDEDFVRQLAESGCRAVLIGFESLDQANLNLMNKNFNTMGQGFSAALGNLRRHGIGVYGTFLFGYSNDTPESFDQAVSFAIDEGMYLAAFAHLTPFPGTPLYKRLQEEGRLRFESWWLDERYRYNELAFTPECMPPEEITRRCVEARRRFYGWPSILKRGLRRGGDWFMLRNFFPLNAMHRNEISVRNGFPLGNEAEPLLERA